MTNLLDYPLPGWVLLLPMVMLSLAAYRLGRTTPSRVSFSRTSAGLTVVLIVATTAMSVLLSFRIDGLARVYEKAIACLLILTLQPTAWYLHGSILSRFEHDHENHTNRRKSS